MSWECSCGGRSSQGGDASSRLGYAPVKEEEKEKEKCSEGEVVGSVALLDLKRLGGEEVKLKQMKADELGVLVRWTTESRRRCK